LGRQEGGAGGTGFSQTLCHYLGFNDDDLRIASLPWRFCAGALGQLGHLQNRRITTKVSEQFIKRVARIAEKNKSRL